MERQLLYKSTSAKPCSDGDLEKILHQSRINNGMEDVTGLLWSDGLIFVQVLEGTHGSVGEIYRRICADCRHYSIVKVIDDAVAERQFGSWSMSYRRSFETEDEYDRRCQSLLSRIAIPLRFSFAVHMVGTVRDEVLRH